MRASRVDLYNCPSRVTAGIGDICLQIDRQTASDFLLLSFHSPGTDVEGRIGQAISEGIQDPVPGDGFKVPVADIDVLFIDISTAGPEILRRRIITQTLRDRICKMAGRSDTSRQNVHNAQAADHASLPDIQNRVRICQGDK